MNGMKNIVPVWEMNFSPTTPNPYCGWRPIQNNFRFIIKTFAASSRTVSLTKSFFALSDKTSLFFVFCMARRPMRANFAAEIVNDF